MHIAQVAQSFAVVAAVVVAVASCGGSEPQAVAPAAGSATASSAGSSAPVAAVDPAVARAEAMREEEALLGQVTHARIADGSKPLHTVTNQRLVAALVEAFDPRAHTALSKLPSCRPRLTVELTDDGGAALVTAVICRTAAAAVARFGDGQPRTLSGDEAGVLEQLATGGIGGGCRSTRMCLAAGKCHRRRGRCIAGSDADCRRSAGCKDHGACVRGGPECVASSDADCRASAACREHGLCTARASECIATADSCRRSAGCRRQGRCGAVKNHTRAPIRTAAAVVRPAMVCR